jgi:hypothetical protein
MTDREFIRALESCELAESDFGHAAHVRAAYLYLQEFAFAARFAPTLNIWENPIGTMRRSQLPTSRSFSSIFASAATPADGWLSHGIMSSFSSPICCGGSIHGHSSIRQWLDKSFCSPRK